MLPAFTVVLAPTWRSSRCLKATAFCPSYGNRMLERRCRSADMVPLNGIDTKGFDEIELLFVLDPFDGDPMPAIAYQSDDVFEKNFGAGAVCSIMEE